GFVTARAGSDLDEDVLLVGGILGEEEGPQSLRERRLAGPQILELELGQLAELGIAGLTEEPLGLFDLAEERLVFAEGLDDRLELGSGLGELRVLGAPGRRRPRRAGELPRELSVATLDLTELIEHGGALRRPSGPRARRHPLAGEPPRRRPTWSRPRTPPARDAQAPHAPAPAGDRGGRYAGFRPYFFWKRSTRPAVSTSFCLPVKKGWHFEQISTRRPGRVDRVWTTSPQAHVIVVST